MIYSCSMAIIELAEFLQSELDKRGWSQADLAAASGLNPSMISRALSSGRGMSMESLVAIADALGVRPERVFIGAGIFPPDPAGEPDLLTEKIVHLVSQMDDIDKNDVLQYAEVVLNRSRGRDVVNEFLHRFQALPPEEAKEAMRRLLEDLRIVREREGKSR